MEKIKIKMASRAPPGPTTRCGDTKQIRPTPAAKRETEERGAHSRRHLDAARSSGGGGGGGGGGDGTRRRRPSHKAADKASLSAFRRRFRVGHRN